MILFFDVETNGFMKDEKAPISDLDNFPRVTQLAYSVYERSGKPVMACDTLIKPDGWTIPQTKFFINHGHSTERCNEFGIPAEKAFEEFTDLLNEVDIMVAHNIIFDSRVVGSEMYRLGLKADKKLKFCTMMIARDILKLPNFSKKYPGPYKYPNLQETHKYFLGEKFEDAHDAMADVDACSRIFFAMVEKGHIVLAEKDV